jgi:acyl-CoA thioester hydrolase
MTTAIEYGYIEPVEVHFDDLDAMGVVHNSRYAVLFERALASYWARRGWAFDPKQPHFEQIFFVVREFSIRYRRPITGVGPVHLHFWIDELGTNNIDYRFRVVSADGATVHAEGRRAQVKVDPRTLRPAPISDDVREACRALLVPDVRDLIAS